MVHSGYRITAQGGEFIACNHYDNAEVISGRSLELLKQEIDRRMEERPSVITHLAGRYQLAKVMKVDETGKKLWCYGGLAS